MHSRMDIELLNCINMNMKWNIMKKSRTSTTKRHRKAGADGFELVSKIEETTTAFENKKAGTLKVVDAPLKKRRLVHQSPSPPPQTLCINGEEGPSPGPQTPSVHHEDSNQRCRLNSLSQSQKTKSKSGSRNSKLLKPTRKEVINMDDFSGIELLADAACGSLIHDDADHVDDYYMLKEQKTPGVNSSTVDVKEAIVSLESNGNEGVEKKAVPVKELRLHWDLNTVMDEWEEPFDDSLAEPVVVAEERSMLDIVYANHISVKHDAAISTVPRVENCNGDSFVKTYELVEDLTCSQEVMGKKTITSKTSKVEMSVSKSDVVDSLIHSGKCDDVSTSSTSILQEQIIVKGESDTENMFKIDQQLVSEKVMQGDCRSPKLCKSYCDNKVTSEDPLSECCGSNVTQDEQGHMAEEDSEDKLQAGYDSPFEDGELREPVENSLSEKVALCYESDNLYKGDFSSTENPSSEKVEPGPDHGQTMEDRTSLLVKETIPNNDIEQVGQVDTFKKPPHIAESGKEFCERKDGHDESRPVGGNIDASTSFDVCRNGEYVLGSRSSNIGDTYSRSGRDSGGPFVDSSVRIWDLKSHRSLDSNHSRNYNAYRAQNLRRSSPSERNNGYANNRGPPARSHSRDRCRGGSGFHSQEYHDHRPCYLERKPRFSPNFNRPSTRSRSRSRSGSPIAWHFQKRKNLDSSNSDETKTVTRGHVSPERPSSKGFDDRRFRDSQFRTMQRNQRFESIGYPERLKSDDHIRFTQHPARFSQINGQKYRDNSDAIRKYDGHCEKVNRVGRPDDDDGGGMRRLYPRVKS